MSWIGFQAGYWWTVSQQHAAQQAVLSSSRSTVCLRYKTPSSLQQLHPHQRRAAGGRRAQPEQPFHWARFRVENINGFLAHVIKLIDGPTLNCLRSGAASVITVTHVWWRWNMQHQVTTDMKPTVMVTKFTFDLNSLSFSALRLNYCPVSNIRTDLRCGQKASNDVFSVRQCCLFLFALFPVSFKPSRRRERRMFAV